MLDQKIVLLDALKSAYFRRFSILIDMTKFLGKTELIKIVLHFVKVWLVLVVANGVAALTELLHDVPDRSEVKVEVAGYMPHWQLVLAAQVNHVNTFLRLDQSFQVYVKFLEGLLVRSAARQPVEHVLFLQNSLLYLNHLPYLYEVRLSKNDICSFKLAAFLLQ